MFKKRPSYRYRDSKWNSDEGASDIRRKEREGGRGKEERRVGKGEKEKGRESETKGESERERKKRGEKE